MKKINRARDIKLECFIKWIEAIKDDNTLTDSEVIKLIKHHSDFIVTAIKNS